MKGWLSGDLANDPIPDGTIGTYVALSPPHPNTKRILSTGDTLRRLNLANGRFTNIALGPLGLLALYASGLAYLYPDIPPILLRYGAANGLNPNLITWSTATSIPLVLILCAGVPLRLVSYASLGQNFTFALAEPDRLKTTGIYHYVQHPSYTGLLILVVCNVLLLVRIDGALSCFIPTGWYHTLQSLERTLLAPAVLSPLMFGMWARVRQEERMLHTRFGVSWESWHARTARFVPWFF
ncbi:hypothetical protein GGR54DRAFT_644964 [Hypoxylon sp. NC1633]|nr:hypothetical protein GGR54DRAFT_644964 [Hypoxylon sp. NC1633]